MKQSIQYVILLLLSIYPSTHAMQQIGMTNNVIIEKRYISTLPDNTDIDHLRYDGEQFHVVLGSGKGSNSIKPENVQFKLMPLAAVKTLLRNDAIRFKMNTTNRNEFRLDLYARCLGGCGEGFFSDIYKPDDRYHTSSSSTSTTRPNPTAPAQPSA